MSNNVTTIAFWLKSKNGYEPVNAIEQYDNWNEIICDSSKSPNAMYMLVFVPFVAGCCLQCFPVCNDKFVWHVIMCFVVYLACPGQQYVAPLHCRIDDILRVS